MQETRWRGGEKLGITKLKISHRYNQSLRYLLWLNNWKPGQSLPTRQRNQKLRMCHEIPSFQAEHLVSLLWRRYLNLVWYSKYDNHSRNNRIWNLLNRSIHHEQRSGRWFLVRCRLHSFLIYLWNFEFVLNLTSQEKSISVHQSSVILYLWW